MSVFAEAAELPAAHRSAFLDSACSGEPALRREVEELLTCAEPAAAAFQAASQLIVQPDPDQIGPYDIIEQIGEGGMAVVYRARQNHPVRRTVALKLIKLGMDTRQFVARFEAERQALAVMDHPNVARVYDAGSTDTGRPYFVMEYVPGEPLLDYCDGHNLNLRQRLELFVVVCEAVEHAHRKGIIHRDLKNTNVLVAEVDGRPVPKVIDFGVAKVLHQPLGERAIQTEQGQLLGTPEYMSPEQAERGTLDIDTRADVFSLGVLLYELIAGVPPISSEALRKGSLDQVQRIIRETEPPRPSTRLSTLAGADAAGIARRRGTALPTLIRDLRSELEWIPLKAMRKDREQRYRSAAELADDIRNYLNGRPLIAGPESNSYRTLKLIRRHKAGVAAASAMLLLLVAGVVVASMLTVRARRAEALALAERDNARATLEFLTDSMLAGATPEKIPDAKVRDQIVKAMIEPAAAGVGDSFKDRPLIEASVRDAIQSVLREIGRGDLALPHAEAALAIRHRLLGADHPDTLQSLHNSGRVLRTMGRMADAEAAYREAFDRRRRVLGEDHPDTHSSLNNYATLLDNTGRSAEAEPLLRDLLERRRRLLGEVHPSTIMSLNNYAHVLHELARYAEAEPLYRETLERRRRLQGEEHPLTILALNNYADVLVALDRLDEAEPLSRQAVRLYERVYGVDHADTITARSNYAHKLSRLGRHAEAEQIHRQAFEQRRRMYGLDHPDTLFSMSQLGAQMHFGGRVSEAEPLIRESFERTRSLLGASHPATLRAQGHMSTSLYALKRFSEAESVARDGLERATSNPSLGPSNPKTRALASALAQALQALGRSDEAADVRRKYDLPIATTRPDTEPARNSS